MTHAAPGLGELPIDVPALLAALADYHGRQLGDANLEAAKWRTAATAARIELDALRARIAELEARFPGGEQ
jgi:hypothetical protein